MRRAGEWVGGGSDYCRGDHLEWENKATPGRACERGGGFAGLSGAEGGGDKKS